MSRAPFTKTLKVRIKDKHAPLLRQWARSVNTVWNYINELSTRSIRERHKFLSNYDVQKYTNGSGKELGLHSQTVQSIGKEYVTRRIQFKKSKLNWRVSHRASSKYSLGWVPVNTGMASWKSGQVYHNGHYFGVWDSYGLAKYKFRTASFNEDSRGRWYFNVVVSVEEKLSPGQDAIGIDLGLKEVATCSDGTELGVGRWYRMAEARLAVAQRANKKARVKALHAKIKNQRKDALHKFSRALVDRCGEIYIGNVSSSKLVKTTMAKSVLDAGWSALKTMLEYKGAHAGIVVREVNERFSTQTCSECGSISGPKGVAGLGIRAWICPDCGAEHQRDINAAKNILGRGRAPLAVGIPCL
jgi:putative transposase